MPGARHRARQRGGHRRRAQRAGQLPGPPPAAASVDDADHRVRRPPDRRPRHGRLARLAEGDAAQLDRAQPRRPRRVRARRHAGACLSVFTTRPDTLYGVTFIAVAPEHPLLDSACRAATPTERRGVARRRAAGRSGRGFVSPARRDRCRARAREPAQRPPARGGRRRARRRVHGHRRRASADGRARARSSRPSTSSRATGPAR